MPTMNVSVNENEVPVQAHDLAPDTLEQVIESPKFVAWLDSIAPKLTLSSIHIQSVDMFGASVGFVKMRVVVIRSGGKSQDVIVVLRGGTSVIFPVLVCEGKLYTAAVKQMRVPVGNDSYWEIPAGMIDGESYESTAIRELEEETSIKLDFSAAIELSQTGPMFVTPGLLDEKMMFYSVEAHVKPDELSALQGLTTGVEHENESLVVEVIRMDEVPSKLGHDMKSMMAYLLYVSKLSSSA